MHSVSFVRVRSRHRRKIFNIVARIGDKSVSARKLLAALWWMEQDDSDEGTSVASSRGSCSSQDLWWTADRYSLSMMEGSFMENTFTLEKGYRWNPVVIPTVSKKVGRKNISNFALHKGRILAYGTQEWQPTKDGINELKANCRLLKKKLDDEIMSREKEIEGKVHEGFERMRLELGREKQRRKRVERLNSELNNKLERVALKLECLKQDYMDERHCREAIEEEYNDLVRKAANDMNTFEELKLESIKIQEEMEEERRMLQLAEVWREERVQMKLFDAKLTLHDKYEEMNKFIDQLENYMASKRSELPWVELRKAEKIRENAKLIRMDNSEFSYVKPRFNDLNSVMQEIKEYETLQWGVEHSNQFAAEDVSALKDF